VQEFEDQPCLVCGSAGHQQWACPNKAISEVYKLPDQMQGAVNDLYQRDIDRVHVSARLLNSLGRVCEFGLLGLRCKPVYLIAAHTQAVNAGAGFLCAGVFAHTAVHVEVYACIRGQVLLLIRTPAFVPVHTLQSRQYHSKRKTGL